MSGPAIDVTIKLPEYLLEHTLAESLQWQGDALICRTCGKQVHNIRVHHDRNEKGVSTTNLAWDCGDHK